MLKLICIDVDGTLVGTAGDPSEAVWAATSRAVDQGQHLALCTARGAFGKSWDYAKQLDPAGWHIFHAGAALIHTGTGERITAELSGEQVEHCESVAAQNDWVIEFYDTDGYAVASDDKKAQDHAALMGVPFEARDRSSLTGAIVRVQFVVAESEADAVLAEVPAGTKGTAAVSPVQPGVAFVSIIDEAVNKGTAAGEIAARLDIGLDGVMMVGDGHNDLDALRVVGHPVAMGNAAQEVLDVATHVVGHVDSDGLVEALTLSETL